MGRMIPDNVQLGDLAVIRSGNDFVSRGIRAFTGHPPFLRPATYNHAELYVGPGHAGDPNVMLSFDADGGKIRPWRHDNEPHVWSTGQLNVSPYTGITIAEWALSHLAGKGYGYLGIANIALMQLGIHITQLSDLVVKSGEFFCSQSVDVAYQAAGIHLFNDGRQPYDVTPEDLAWRIEGKVR